MPSPAADTRRRNRNMKAEDEARAVAQRRFNSTWNRRVVQRER